MDGYEFEHGDMEWGEDPEFIANGEDRCWCCGKLDPGDMYCDICWLLHVPATSEEAREAYWDLVIDEILKNTKPREG